jgi:hypothetical protein
MTVEVSLESQRHEELEVVGQRIREVGEDANLGAV